MFLLEKGEFFVFLFRSVFTCGDLCLYDFLLVFVFCFPNYATAGMQIVFWTSEGDSVMIHD